jgi:hypothetical protein
MEDTVSHNDNAYTYDILPDAQGYFRYLVLKAGSDDEPLACDIHTARIEDVSYEAISYVWGSEQKPETMLCGEQMIPITVNLHAALARLRLPDEERVLWADSVCIDQDNLQEKGPQVAQMGDIYREASHVLICLDDDVGEHALGVSHLLAEIAEKIRKGKETVSLHDWDSFPWPESGEDILTDPRWSSLEALLRHDWFARGWVVREAAFARAATIIWGPIQFKWDHLMQTLIWHSLRASTFGELYPYPSAHVSAYESQHPQLVRMFYLESCWSPTSLLEYLDYGRILGLTDARDRIYAFLGLAAGSDPVTITPDYSIAPPEAYWGFASQYIKSTNDPDLLAFVIHDEQSLFSDIPSWVPRWDVNSAELFTDPWRSRKTSRTRQASSARLINPDTLEVKGICFDRIAVASGILRSHTTTHSILVDIWHSSTPKRASLVYKHDEQVDAFMRTLTSGSSAGNANTWNEQKEGYMKIFSSEVEIGTEDGRPLEGIDFMEIMEKNFFHELKLNTHGHRFIVTQRGYFGLVPAVAAVGDTCAIIFGSRSTCVLRGTDQASHYTYLGSSYILGRNWKVVDREFGTEGNKEWVDWDIDEQTIFLR